MTATPEQWHATLVLHCLLEPDAAPEAAAPLNWPLLGALARRNAVLVRLADRFARWGIPVPAAFTAAAAAERRRGQAVLEAVATISAACGLHGIAFLFPKMLDHYPDFGSDLDLLVLAPALRTDGVILAATPGAPAPLGLWERLAGATTYILEGSGLTLDVQHERLGIIGEHTWYPVALVANRRALTVAGVAVYAPAPEDRVVLQCMDRVYGRRHFRLTDVAATVRLLRDAGLDWSYIEATARALGMLPGLSCYLSYVDRIHRDVYGRDLVTGAPRRWLTLDGWGDLAFRDGAFCFPATRVGGRLYWHQLGSAVEARDWSVASRLCLLPPLVAAGGVRRLARRLRSHFHAARI